MQRRILSRLRSRRALAATVALVAVGALVLTGCSSSKGSSGASSSAGGATNASIAAAASASPTGTPIKVMTIASVNYTGPNYANILTTAKLAESWYNSHGGIDGHPLKVTTCDEQGDPNKIATCGRQAISDGDIAVVGSFTLNGDAIIPILTASNTAWFGICCPASLSELKSPIVTILGSGATGAYVVKAVQDGCKKIAYVTLDAGAITQNGINQVKDAFKTLGASDKFAKTVLIPVTAQDYSAQVAQATTDTDCIIAIIAEANFPPFLNAFASSGATQRIYGEQGNLDNKIAKQFPAATNNDVSIGFYSDLSLPPWDDYRAAIKDYKAPSDEDYNSLGGLGTWAAYYAFDQVIKGMGSTPITPASFLAASKKATVKMNGMSPDVDFSQQFTGLGPSFVNQINQSVTYDIVKNGKLVPFQNGKFYDLTQLTLNKPLSAENTPPGGQ
jgi:ABC-type branched-subunit amino acid transport system substrate-binding protein